MDVTSEDLFSLFLYPIARSLDFKSFRTFCVFSFVGHPASDGVTSIIKYKTIDVVPTWVLGLISLLRIAKCTSIYTVQYAMHLLMGLINGSN